MAPQRVLVTGAAGFIGNAFLRRLLAERPGVAAMTFDALTYAGHEENLADLPGAERHQFVRGDVAVAADVERALAGFQPDAVVHFAAETHVDRSILQPEPFLRTNILGTQVLLDACREAGIRLVCISTDEVYGSLAAPRRAAPDHPLAPSNVYAATKAAGDLLAQAAFRTHGQDVLVTRSTNNYGPRQMPEKLIPLMILRAHAGESLPVYGHGLQERDWLHVDDHSDGILAALERGQAGATYHFGGGQGRTNLAMVEALLAACGRDGARIEHVRDRPGHDQRYALDDGATREELGWTPVKALEEGLAETIAWYLGHADWCRAVAGDDLRAFLEANYGDR